MPDTSETNCSKTEDGEGELEPAQKHISDLVRVLQT